MISLDVLEQSARPIHDKAYQDSHQSGLGPEHATARMTTCADTGKHPQTCVVPDRWQPVGDVYGSRGPVGRRVHEVTWQIKWCVTLGS